MKLEPRPPKNLAGDESLHKGGVPYRDSFGGATILDFWRWAFSNLRLDEIRGPFAEFLVARLAGEHTQQRTSWPYDFVTSAGVRVEVKSAAYLQDWPQKHYTTIKFSGLKSRLMSPSAGFAGEKAGHADVYVFCVLVTKEHERFDPLDLAEWEFYAVSSQQLDQINRGKDSISLALLRKHVQPCLPEQLAGTIAP